jgi:dTDP-4-amino-4,6-dideoxygalactose transaminase
MLNTSFSSWPSFTTEEAEAIKNTLLSNKVNYWTGNECRLFEKNFAHWVGSEYAIALANGTLALDLILNAMKIGLGDEVVVTSRTFIASVSSIINTGAIPVFADVDKESQNITAETIKAVLTDKTKAIVCVHLGGWPCDMEAIMELANKNNLLVIEDCAQAHGAKLNDRSVGSFGHASAWSFCQDKIMTTGGEGGMVTTNDTDLWNKMWSFKDHGKSWEAVYEKKHPPGFRWVHESFGSNYRMLEIQAVLGLMQLKMMPVWHNKRNEYAKKIWHCASKIKALRVPIVPDNMVHAAYKCYVFIEPNQLKKDWSRDKVVQEINNLGVPCFMGSCSEVYLEKAFNNKEFKPKKRLPVAKELGDTSLMFLVHPTLTADEITKTCDVLEQVMREAVG